MIRRALLLALLLNANTLHAHKLHAQDPPPPRPIPVPAPAAPPAGDSSAVRDSLLRIDSLRALTKRDSLPKQFPQMQAAQQQSFATGTWAWDLNALQREGAMTVGDLLRRIPAMLSVRSGGYLQPEAATAFGQTRGRIQVEVDGYVLDPLTESTYDLARVELVTLTGLTVERHLDMTRIKLTTAQPVLANPYTRVEAATGQPDANAFRAIFLVPKVIVGPLGGALDRLSTNGNGGSEPADALTGWAKWTWTNGARGLQLEFKRQNLNRLTASPWPLRSVRQDVVLRARSSLMTGLTAELYAGQSRITNEPDTTNSTVPDSLRPPALKRDNVQAGARASFTKGAVFANAALRIRNADALPSQEFEFGGGINLKMIQAAADVTQQAWKDGPGAMSWDVRAQAGPVSGFGVFAELSDGDRGAPIYADSAGISVREDHALTTRSGMRGGVTVEKFGLTGGAAYVKIDGNATTPFGLPFDSASPGNLVDPATGLEMWGRLPFMRNRLAIDAGYTYWTKLPGWTYIPSRTWRIAGEMHLDPLPTHNLEIFARLESVYRGLMRGYLVEGVTGVPADSVIDATSELPSNHLLNGYLQIRVIDVRAYIQWEDMLGKGRMDVLDRVIRGPRVHYGVKWQLFN